MAKRLQAKGLLILTLILILTLLNPVVSDVEIVELETPILPLELGQTKMIETKHTFLHFVETNWLIVQLKNIEIFYDKIINITKSPNIIREVHEINNLLSHAQYLIQITKSKIHNLLPHQRNKRGAIDGIGTLSKWLFGTLDHNDEIKYDQQIKKLSQTQNSILEELKIQTSLNDHLIQHYNKTIINLHENQVLIDNKLKQVISKVNHFTDDIYIYISLQNALDQTILNCQNLINFLYNLENSIIFAHLGNLHTSIINIDQLSILIDHAVKIYGNNKIYRFKNFYTYYQLMNIQIFLLGTKIIFAIHLPIINIDDFHTFHIIGLPYQNTIILPKHPYLILGTTHHQFGEQLCPQLEDVYFCQYHEEIITDQCIIPLMRAEKSSCRVQKAVMENPLIEEINNKFVLLLPTATKAIIVQTNCEKTRLLNVQKNSLLKIPKGCSITAGNLTFENTEEVSQGNPLILPKINFDLESQAKIENDDDLPLKLKSINFEAIKELQLEARSIHPTSVKEIHPAIWNFPSFLMTVLVIISIVSFWLWKKRTSRKNRHPQEDIPVPENKPSSVLFSLKEGGVK